MKCQNCGEREAIVHFTKILNGEKQEYNLCEPCAQKLKTFSENESFDFHKFFSGIMDSEFPFSSNKKQKNELVCSFCKMKYLTFKKIGKVGCDQCYNSFGEYIDPLIRRIHGSDKHTGKIPHNAAKEIKINREVEGLKKNLQRAIEREEYEEAAKIRDELKNRTQEK